MKERTIVAAILISFLASTLSCPTQVAAPITEEDNWPMFHHDAHNSGYSSLETSLVTHTEPYLLWSYEAMGQVAGSPVVADVDKDGTKEVFIESAAYGGPILYCFDESGVLKWTFQGETQEPWYTSVFTTPAIGDIDSDGIDEILFKSHHPITESPYKSCGALYCLSADGQLNWKHMIPIRRYIAIDGSSPTIADVNSTIPGLEIVVQNGAFDLGVIHCVSSTGQLIWEHVYSAYPYAWPATVAPVVADLSVTVPGLEIVTAVDTDSDRAALLCLDSRGNLLWRRDDINVASSCTVEDVDEDGSFEILVGGDGVVYCLNTAGETMWLCTEPLDRVFSTPAVSDIDADGDKEIVFGSQDNYVYCLGWDGTLEWKYKTGGAVSSSPALADVEKLPGDLSVQLETVVGSMDGMLYVLNSTGKCIWTYAVETDYRLVASPAIVDLYDNGIPDIVFGAHETIGQGGSVYALAVVPPVAAIIDIDPDVLNVGPPHGPDVSVFIELPPSHDIHDVNVTTIRLNCSIPQNAYVFSDDVLMVKFDRDAVINLIDPPPPHWCESINVTLEITGKLNDETPFHGSDIILVINKGPH